MTGPTAAELLDTPGAFLTRRHLAQLGLTRTAIDCAFRALPVVFFPGQTKGGSVRREDFLALVERSTYTNDDGRVRPT